MATTPSPTERGCAPCRMAFACAYTGCLGFLDRERLGMPWLDCQARWQVPELAAPITAAVQDDTEATAGKVVVGDLGFEPRTGRV